MARENIGQILIDNECVTDVPQLRTLMASGKVRQGQRVLTNRNEKVDTADGPITVGESVTIHDWLDHSLN